MGKVYYFHTTKLDSTKLGITPASTIALKMSDDKTQFHYGVAICSKYDNFSKKYGREVAENRLNQGFGIITVPKLVDLNGLSDHQACMSQLINLVISVVKKNRKWKKKITRFNIEQKQGAKIIELPTYLSNRYGDTTTQS